MFWTLQSLKTDPLSNLRWWHFSDAGWIRCKWPDDVLSEFDEEFIPQVDEFDSEDNLEVNSEESNVASEWRFQWRLIHWKIRNKRDKFGTPGDSPSTM